MFQEGRVPPVLSFAVGGRLGFLLPHSIYIE